MSQSDGHVFICCGRGDLLGWLEASWFAEQGLEIWCEDGVNPGTPDWNECRQAISDAMHCVFLVTEKFLESPDALDNLQAAVELNASVVAIYLEEVPQESAVAGLLSQCVRIDKYRLSPPDYVAELSDAIGHIFASIVPPTSNAARKENYAYKVGDWRVYPRLLRVATDNESKTLDRRVLDVLDMLVRRAPEVVTIDEFHNEVWKGSIVEDNSLHRAISLLRKALRDDARNPEYVETIPRSGYRLVCPVFWHESVPEEPQYGVHKSAAYVQLKLFQGIGGTHADTIALALTTELQNLLLANRRFALMPRSDQVDDQQRRPKYIIAGSVQIIGDGMRVALELNDLSQDRIEWSWIEHADVPGSFKDQAALAEKLAGTVLGALERGV